MNVMAQLLNAYCGSPPSPAELWVRWNFDPPLLAALATALIVYAVLMPRATRWERRAYCAGWLVTALALISPLCALSVSLLSARVGQHIILVVLAAPMLAYGLRNVRAHKGSALTAGTVFSVLLWVWHTPAPYAATFTSDITYWLMHVTLLGSAVWLWRACMIGDRRLKSLLALILTGMQMTVLGAVLAFSSRPLFSPHLLTTDPWGLTQLADQQLAGVLMWAPGGVLFLCAALAIAYSALLRSADEAAATPITARRRATSHSRL